MSQYDAANGGTMTLYSPVNIPNRMLSLFGRINYSLMDRYLATVTFRADGSSKFPGSHRWGYFPAAALAWRVSEEAFMKEVDWLDNLKLRLSYGEVGNDGISSGMWTQLRTAEGDNRWQYALNHTWQPAYDLASAQMANDELKWETTVTRNIGLDFGLLNGRLWGTLDLYHNTTRDLLMLTQLPAITGFTSAFKNLGQTSNKGVELSLSGVIYKDRDWNVTAGFNINFNRGNVDELADGVTGQYGTQWIQQNRPADDYILIEGRPVGLVRGLVSEGFYTPDDFDYANGMYTLKQGVADVSTYIIPEFYGPDANGRPGTQNAYPGMAKFKDLNDDGVIDTDDYDIIGDMNPVHTGGFNLNASYKGFDLGLYFNWSYGNEVYNVTRLASFYGYSRGGVFENKLAFMKDAYKLYDIQGGQLVRVTTPDELKALNVNAKYPLAYNAMGIVSDLGIEDGSYLRLNTLTLGYTLPKTLLAKAGISNLRLYGTVYNLLTLTGYSGLDPEVNANSNVNNATYPTTGLDWGAYPRSRSFVLGMNLTF
jgi:TonB-linked SusC/RagA family outer membrane protein